MTRRAVSITAVAVVVSAVLLFAGCTSSNGSSDSSSSVGQVSRGAEIPQQDLGTTEFGAVDGASSTAVSADRAVVTTGSVSVTVADPIAATQSAVTITEQAGGRIDSRTENPKTDTQPASATLVLRIPADGFDRTLADIKHLGTVNYVSLNATDVTGQSTDLDARITALTTSVDRLLALMTTATSTADLITIESALSDRQAQLESLQAQRSALDDQIDYSTVSLELYSEGVVAAGGPDTFWSGFVAGWNALVATLSGAVVVVGVLLPWLAVIAVLGGIALLIRRVSTRKGTAA